MNSSSLLTLKEEYGYNSFQSLGLQRCGPVAFRDFPVKLMLSKTFYSTYSYSGSLGDSAVKNLPANGSGRWTEEPGGLQFMWSQRVGHG